MAPIAPFYADRLYVDLTEGNADAKASVHLADFPTVDESVINKTLEKDMETAQNITSMVLALRRKANLKVRQPLSMIMIPVLDSKQKDSIEAMSLLIKNEVNVKTIKYVDGNEGVLVKRVKPDFKKLGPKYGKIMKQLAAEIAGMTQEEIIAFEKEGQFTFEIDNASVCVELSDVEIFSEDIPGWLVANEGSLTVALDITVTDDLRKEGIAREIVNRIQNIRKNIGLEITDKIQVVISPNPKTDDAVAEYSDYIAHQVLAESIRIAEIPENERTDLNMEEFDNLCASIKRAETK